MKIYSYKEDSPDGPIKCLFVDVGNTHRILIALATNSWYTKGVQRRIPIWIDKENPKGYSLFFYRLAIRFGRRKFTNDN